MFERLEDKSEKIVAKDFIRSFLKYSEGLSRVKRWRDDEATESPFLTPEEVANRSESLLEHQGGMVLLADWVFKLADYYNDQSILELDFRKVVSLINIHDAEEVLEGDVNSNNKDEDYYKREAELRNNLFRQADNLPFGKILSEDLEAYQSKELPETKFVKALDELQAIFFMLSTDRVHKTNRNYGDPSTVVACVYVEEFPSMKKIMDVARNMILKHELIDLSVKEL